MSQYVCVSTMKLPFHLYNKINPGFWRHEHNIYSSQPNFVYSDKIWTGYSKTLKIVHNLSICTLSVSRIVITVYVVLSKKICEQCIGKDAEGSCHGLLQSTIHVLASGDPKDYNKTSVKIPYLQGIWSRQANLCTTKFVKDLVWHITWTTWLTALSETANWISVPPFLLFLLFCTSSVATISSLCSMFCITVI
jgi:hypothetical protein